MEQPVPNVTDADVVRIVERDFGSPRAGEVLALLGGLDVGPRVRLAILKIANGDLEELHNAAKLAVRDDRDVLAAAEYPRYTREIGFSDVSETLENEVIESDWKQYQEWLELQHRKPDT